uniref:glycerate kinase n=1 Tax=uncultured Propionibacterium sp. TaxID=218066 RepID=UPI00292E1CB5
AGATAVLTGGGAADPRAPTGGTVADVTAAARESDVPVIVFAGRPSGDARTPLDQGVAALAPVTPEGGQNLRAAVAGWVREQS